MCMVFWVIIRPASIAQIAYRNEIRHLHTEEDIGADRRLCQTMFPWGHAALAYLLYTVFLQTKYNSVPRGGLPLIVVVASLVPDLIDKPLAWTFGVLPGGRTLFHSLVVLIPLCVGLYWIAHRYRNPSAGAAAVIGLLSHPLGDMVQSSFTSPYFETPTYLLWPLVPVTESSNAGFHILWEFHPGPFFYVELLLTGLAIALWMYHGRPGLGVLRDVIK
jgi:membrane-bound metal-dependent hydrolase YbcI (DUF457 family)